MSILYFGQKRPADAPAEEAGSNSVCASGECIRVPFTENDGMSCWAESGFSLFAYPLATRALLKVAASRLAERVHTRSRGALLSEVLYAVAWSITEYDEDYDMPDGVYQSCPEESPSRAFHNAATELYGTRAPKLPLGNAGKETDFVDNVISMLDAEVMPGVCLRSDIHESAAIYPFLQNSPDNTRSCAFFSSHIQAPPPPVDCCGFSLVGVSFYVRSAARDMGHIVSFLRCNEDRDVWILNDALSKYSSYSSLSFTLEDMNFLNGGHNSWGSLYENSFSLNTHESIRQTLLYARTEEMYENKRARSQKCELGRFMNTAIPLLNPGKVQWKDLILAFAGYPETDDGRKARPTDSWFLPNSMRDVNSWTSKTLNAWRVRAKSVEYISDSSFAYSDEEVVSVYYAPDPRRLQTKQPYKTLTCGQGFHFSASSILTTLPSGVAVLLLRCKEDHNIWTLFDTQSSTTGPEKKSTIFFDVGHFNVFWSEKQTSIQLVHGGTFTLDLCRGRYPCVILYEKHPGEPPLESKGDPAVHAPEKSRWSLPRQWLASVPDYERKLTNSFHTNRRLSVEQAREIAKSAIRHNGVPKTWNVQFRYKRWPVMQYELDDTKGHDVVSFTSRSPTRTVSTHETFTFIPVEGSLKHVVVYRFTFTVEWLYIVLACLAWFRLAWELRGTKKGLREFISSVEEARSMPTKLML